MNHNIYINCTKNYNLKGSWSGKEKPLQTHPGVEANSVKKAWKFIYNPTWHYILAAGKGLTDVYNTI